MTNGIQGLIVDTHNWGKTVAFWKGLGFELVFETDHGSGQLRHPRGGPYLFLREVPADRPLAITPVLTVDAPAAFEPPRAGTVTRGFETQHWGVTEMLLADPDGRSTSIQSPPARPEPKPDDTAVRTALWRALHVTIDAAPHVLEDVIGLALAAPEPGWEKRGDMHPQGTSRFRASIVARQRFIEDLALSHGAPQYVILGAGLDTFAQRRPDLAAKMQIFEVERPIPQAWKRKRLDELGYGVPANLHLVPVDFESGVSVVESIQEAGFDPKTPAVVVATGVMMYLTREANTALLEQLTALAPGSAVALSFMVPFEMLPPDERAGAEMAKKGAAANGTPFLSFFEPAAMIAFAKQCGLANATVVNDLGARYFANRPDGLTPSSAEPILLVNL